MISYCFYFFFFNDTATTEIYTLSLHDALPIWTGGIPRQDLPGAVRLHEARERMVLSMVNESARALGEDRKSTRLNSSHANISYAVFCLKKKKQLQRRPT